MSYIYPNISTLISIRCGTIGVSHGEFRMHRMRHMKGRWLQGFPGLKTTHLCPNRGNRTATVSSGHTVVETDFRADLVDPEDETTTNRAMDGDSSIR